MALTAEMRSIISSAANEFGVSPATMIAIAAQESRFNPSAKASTSSATGLFQIIDSTWKDLTNRYGAKFGITANSSRHDARVNAFMAAALAAENASMLRAAGVPVNTTSLYLAHFASPAKAIAVMKAAPSTPASQIFSQAQINANRSILSGKTAAQVTGFFDNKMNAAKAAYAPDETFREAEQASMRNLTAQTGSGVPSASGQYGTQELLADEAARQTIAGVGARTSRGPAPGTAQEPRISGRPNQRQASSTIAAGRTTGTAARSMGSEGSLGPSKENLGPYAVDRNLPVDIEGNLQSKSSFDAGRFNPAARLARNPAKAPENKPSNETLVAQSLGPAGRRSQKDYSQRKAAQARIETILSQASGPSSRKSKGLDTILAEAAGPKTRPSGKDMSQRRTAASRAEASIANAAAATPPPPIATRLTLPDEPARLIGAPVAVAGVPTGSTIAEQLTGQPQFGPPAPQYGPPAPQYGPPAPQYGPPAPQYGPPAPQYGPPMAAATIAAEQSINRTGMGDRVGNVNPYDITNVMSKSVSEPVNTIAGGRSVAAPSGTPGNMTAEGYGIGVGPTRQAAAQPSVSVSRSVATAAPNPNRSSFTPQVAAAGRATGPQSVSERPTAAAQTLGGGAVSGTGKLGAPSPRAAEDQSMAALAAAKAEFNRVDALMPNPKPNALGALKNPQAVENIFAPIGKMLGGARRQTAAPVAASNKGTGATIAAGFTPVTQSGIAGGISPVGVRQVAGGIGGTGYREISNSAGGVSRVSDEGFTYGGGGGGPGGTFLCTLARDYGALTDEQWQHDLAYGALVSEFDPDLYFGYAAWAEPFAAFLRRDSFATNLMRTLAIWAVCHWIDGDAIGRAIHFIGAPICRFIGRMTTRGVLNYG